jgi:hypothetical protein
MGAFAKAADALLEGAAPDWEQRLAAQRARLYEHIQTSEQEAAGAARKNIEHLTRKAFELGYAMRRQRHQEMYGEASSLGAQAVPRRELTVGPGRHPDAVAGIKSAGVMSAIGNPVGETVQDARTGLINWLDERFRKGTQVTTDPGTLAWYYPSMATAAPKAFMQGFRQADTDMNAAAHVDVDAKIEAARKAFHDALAGEWRERRGGVKNAADAGEMIDWLAQEHIKTAEGELNQILGGYLALASLLGQGTHHLAESMTMKRDPAQQRLRAIKELLLQRQLAQPAPIRVAEAPDTAGMIDGPDVSALSGAADEINAGTDIGTAGR